MQSFAGSFLVARSKLQDRHFKRSVVLILQHDDDGAYGLVVNKPMKADELPFPIFAGGPCPAPGLVMLHGHNDWLEPVSDDSETEKSPEVAPGVFIGDSACLAHAVQSLANEPLRFRVFRGYAGWGPGQLESELASGAWAIVPAKAQWLFDTDPEELWDHLAPSSLPQPSLN